MKNKLDSSALKFAFALGGSIIGLLFLSSNLTGYVTASSSLSDYNILGSLLFVSGLVCSFIWLKKFKR